MDYIKYVVIGRVSPRHKHFFKLSLFVAVRT